MLPTGEIELRVADLVVDDSNRILGGEVVAKGLGDFVVGETGADAGANGLRC